MGRNTNEGAGETVTMTIGAGLYEFLTLHARRAVLGKNQGEIAAYMIQQQALAWNDAEFMGIKLPTRDFPNPTPEGG
jgi:hypothetical protein